MGRIGIFGGSFDPPHLGHRLAVSEFQKLLELDRVLVVPDAVPPHKALSALSPDAQTRLRLTRLAMRELPFAEVSDIELRRGGTSYTVDTLRSLRAQHPHDELFLLMGTDMLLSFEKWRAPREIASMATLAVAHRSDDRAEELRACAERLQAELGARVVLVENKFVPYSSTSVRAMLAFGCAEDYVSPEVLESIRSEGLYGVGADFRRLPFERLQTVSLALHNPKRVPHVIGCSQTAERLALQYGANPVDAKRAGILHDVTKALTGTEQLKLCESYGIILNHFEQNHPKLLHAKTGATIARAVFGENDAVYRAIYWHTTGTTGMHTLDKIVYLADYMEPNRDFPGVDELRALVAQSLDAGMLCGLRMSVEQLRARGSEVDPNSQAALRELEERNHTT